MTGWIRRALDVLSRADDRRLFAEARRSTDETARTINLLIGALKEAKAERERLGNEQVEASLRLLVGPMEEALRAQGVVSVTFQYQASP